MAGRSGREEMWREAVRAWGRSGLPAKDFAEARGLNPRTLVWWRWRFRSRGEDHIEGKPRSITEPRFVDVVVTIPGAASAPDFVVEVGALRVRVPVGFDGMELRRLVEALC